MAGCVLRDHLGVILGAWVSRFSACNAFVAKARAAIQALKYADNSQSDHIILEGDAYNIIQALK